MHHHAVAYAADALVDGAADRRDDAARLVAGDDRPLSLPRPSVAAASVAR
jgi:hypothetical protein